MFKEKPNYQGLKNLSKTIKKMEKKAIINVPIKKAAQKGKINRRKKKIYLKLANIQKKENPV